MNDDLPQIINNRNSRERDGASGSWRKKESMYTTIHRRTAVELLNPAAGVKVVEPRKTTSQVLKESVTSVWEKEKTDLVALRRYVQGVMVQALGKH